MLSTNEILPQLDKDGHLCNHLDWNETVAKQMAQTNHTMLTDTHFKILYALREFYARFDHAPATRPLIKYLNQHVDSTISNASLMYDFNTGTVARTLARLAGLPKPANCL